MSEIEYEKPTLVEYSRWVAEGNGESPVGCLDGDDDP